MSIISALRTYIQSYSELNTGSPVWVNYLNAIPVEYAIIPLAGGRKAVEYVTGTTYLGVYNFAFQSVESTTDNLERLETMGFYEAFAEWLDSQTASGSLPDLDPDEENPTNKTAIKIEALGFAYLYEYGQSDTGIYQIQCRLEYHQA